MYMYMYEVLLSFSTLSLSSYILFSHIQAAQVQQQQSPHKPAVRRAFAKETVSPPVPKICPVSTRQQ